MTTEHWVPYKSKFMVIPEVDDFLYGLKLLCQTHNMLITWDDDKAEFVVVDYDEDTMNQAMCAHDMRSVHYSPRTERVVIEPPPMVPRDVPPIAQGGIDAIC